mmetsp:Transcript_58422/g.139347  ORF Transcript_58422/g.139347 Transcript_58422/m.139347 type:complete len:296 (+) Transcript_58422:237-1124(+)
MVVAGLHATLYLSIDAAATLEASDSVGSGRATPQDEGAVLHPACGTWIVFRLTAAPAISTILAALTGSETKGEPEKECRLGLPHTSKTSRWTLGADPLDVPLWRSTTSAWCSLGGCLSVVEAVAVASAASKQACPLVVHDDDPAAARGARHSTLAAVVETVALSLPTDSALRCCGSHPPSCCCANTSCLKARRDCKDCRDCNASSDFAKPGPAGDDEPAATDKESEPASDEWAGACFAGELCRCGVAVRGEPACGGCPAEGVTPAGATCPGDFDLLPGGPLLLCSREATPVLRPC